MSNVRKQLMKRRVLEMKDLPSIPIHVQELMRMLRDPDADMDEVMNAINRDVSLVARIMKLVNSTFYALPVEVTSVDHATSLVGFSNVWELLMSCSVMDLISDSQQTLWDHSYTTSLLIQEIVKEEKIKCSPKIGLTMLMHDIGKLVLMKFNESSYKLVRKICMDTQVPQHVLEEKHLGVTHCEAGAWLLESWEMSEDQVTCVLNHHNSSFEGDWAVDTALMQFVDYCDNFARRLPQGEVDLKLLDKVGLGHIDPNKWEIRQRELVFSTTG